MEKMKNVLSRRVYIKNKLGLHARPAAQIAKIAKNASNKVWIIKEGEKVDAASIIDLLTLAGLPGTEMMLQIDDKTDVSVLDEIEALFQNGFGE